MIVVDTDVIGSLYLHSPRSEQAAQALRRDSESVAPLLWHSELRDALVQYMRRGIRDLAGAQRTVNEAVGLIVGREYRVVSSRVLSLAVGSGCPTYDCEFVALADDLGITLVTVDRQVLKLFPRVTLSLDDYVRG